VTYTIAVQHADYMPAPIVNPAGTAVFDADIGVDYSPGAIVMTPLPATAHVTVGPTEALVGLSMVVTVPATGDVVPATIAADGTSTQTGLTPGTTYRFTFTSTNYQAPPFDLTAVANGNQPVTVTMTPKPASAAVAIGPPGALAGLTLIIRQSNPSGGVVPSTLNPDGTATVTGLVPGRTYTFAATATNFQKAPVDVVLVPGINPVNIVMDSKPASAQVVVAPAGALTGLSLAVTAIPSGTLVWTTIDADGTTTVTGLVPGQTYRFAATATNFQKAPVDVPIVAGTNSVNIIMDPKPVTASITIGGAAASAAGRSVSISPSAGVTGPTGSGPYMFTALTPDTNYTFTIAAPGYITFVSAPSTAGPGGTITRTFTPAAFASLTDTVANGTVGDTVYLCAATGVCDAGTNMQAVTLSAGSGAFTFAGLDQGSYRALAFRTAGVNDVASFTVSATGVIAPTTLGLSLP
jgi:hypothetical protein